MGGLVLRILRMLTGCLGTSKFSLCFLLVMMLIEIEIYLLVYFYFRSCDSTFGLAGVGNEDELGWFSPSHTIEGSEDVLKSDFKFSFESSPSKNIQQQHEPSKLNNACSSINGSSLENASVSSKFSSQTSEDDELASVGHLSFATMSDTISESKDECIPYEQVREKVLHVLLFLFYTFVALFIRKIFLFKLKVW